MEEVVAAGRKSVLVDMALTSDSKVVISESSFTDDRGVAHTVRGETSETLRQVDYDGSPVPSLDDCMSFAKANGLEVVLNNAACLTEAAVPYIAVRIASYGMWVHVVVPMGGLVQRL